MQLAIDYPDRPQDALYARGGLHTRDGLHTSDGLHTRDGLRSGRQTGDQRPSDHSASVANPSDAVNHPPAAECSHLTEIIFPSVTTASGLLLSMVSQLSQSMEPRWLTWIGKFPSLRTPHDMALKRIRKLDSDDQRRSLDWTVEALQNGTSHTVLTLIREPLDDVAMQRLESAASHGGSQCVLVRLRA